VKLLGLLASFALVACQGKASATNVDASTDGGAAMASAPVPSPPAASARPDLRAPRVVSLSRRVSSMVDVVPGRPADAEHPAGTVYFATVLDNEARRGEATLFEWDVASAQPLHPEGRLLYQESDKEENGKSTDVRIAASRDDLYVAVTLEKGKFTVLGRSSLTRGGASPVGPGLPPARNLSLETDGQWLAVAYERLDYSYGTAEVPRSGVLLYEAWSMKHVATFPFSQSREVGVRYDILEILDGHLYAAEVTGTKLHVVKLAMPSLQPVKMTDVSVPKGAERVQLTRMQGHLVALTHDVVVELTPDLEVVRRRDLHSDEVAVGPGAELLTPLGLERPGHRGDFVPDVRASASCTPSWAGAYPLLACAVDMEGIRIARLAPR